MFSRSNDVLSNPPCMRSGLMWGIGTGLMIGAHKYRVTKLIGPACDYAVYAFGGVSAVYWVFCRSNYFNRLHQTRQFMDVMNNPNRQAEAQQFLRSRVEQNKAQDDQK